LGESSQQRRDHVRQIRRCSHLPPSRRHSSQPSTTGAARAASTSSRVTTEFAHPTRAAELRSARGQTARPTIPSPTAASLSVRVEPACARGDVRVRVSRGRDPQPPSGDSVISTQVRSRNSGRRLRGDDLGKLLTTPSCCRGRGRRRPSAPGRERSRTRGGVRDCFGGEDRGRRRLCCREERDLRHLLQRITGLREV